MRRFLLLFPVLLGLVQAQDEVSQASAFAAGEGANGEVKAVAVQADGKIVIGGKFTAVNGVPRYSLARLNADGTLDQDFANTQAAGVNGEVNALVIQADGGIIVGGLFTIAGEYETMNLARYKPDGTVDQSFGGDNRQPGTNGVVLALALQADGKIVVGGNFSTAFGLPRQSLARLNADGTLDDSITPKTTQLDGPIRALAAVPDGGAVAGGNFSLPTQNGQNLLRVSAGGN